MGTGIYNLKEVDIEGEREPLSRVIPVELFRGEKLDWEYYEKQVGKMFEEILNNSSILTSMHQAIYLHDLKKEEYFY